jgi:acyl-CoA reductase-like NAD-dependent aldehyde dehydrogenase
MASLAAIRYYAGMADKIQGSTCEVGDTSKSVTVRKEPIGVVAQIVPWNFPVRLFFELWCENRAVLIISGLHLVCCR